MRERERESAREREKGNHNHKVQYSLHIITATIAAQFVDAGGKRKIVQNLMTNLL